MSARAAVALVALVALGTAVPAPAGADACPPPGEERVRAVEAVDGSTLRLADGRVLRLVSVLAPSVEPGGHGAAARTAQAGAAQQALTEMAVGEVLTLAFSGRRDDRHGRLLAHATVEGEGGRWLQAMLVERGLARVYSLIDNRACIAVLLQREAAARDAGLGMWSSDRDAVRRADRPAEMAGDVGRFAIVEGRVRSVGERPLRTYLNFGTYWNEDFTVFVDRGDVSRMAEAGIELGALEGRLVRVRGWVLEDRGPAIQVNHPEQLERVEER